MNKMVENEICSGSSIVVPTNFILTMNIQFNHMKNWTLFILAIIVMGVSSCGENPDFVYHSQDNIYLDYEDTTARMISYSFAYTPEKVEDTIYIPVKISGKIETYDRSFKLVVLDTATTAEPALHYEPFKDAYTMPADSGTVRVPVVIYNKDPELADKTVSLAFALVATEDFKIDFPHLNYAKISFSNRLEQPNWWMFWMGQLGLYSRVKHQLFLISTGTNDMPVMSEPDAYLRVPEALYHISQYTAFVFDPFSWVEDHPEYTLTETENGDYEFYLKETPEKVILLKKDEGTGSYHFIDENGQSI